MINKNKNAVVVTDMGGFVTLVGLGVTFMG